MVATPASFCPNSGETPGPPRALRSSNGSLLGISRGRASFAWMRRLLVGLLFVLALFRSHVASAEPGDELRISLLTMGPGKHPFTKFGHSALWVRDARSNRDEIYNYGTFAFNSRTALLDSVQGKLPYWLSVQSLRGTLLTYEEQGRSLVASELALTPAERSALHAALRQNSLPEHRYYRYDYYRDNCTTRIRDVLDRVLGGSIHRQAVEPASMTYRAHTLRLVADDPLLYVALDLAVGRQTDGAGSVWDEDWLPERLHEQLLRTRLSRDGQLVPLISSERALLVGQFAEPRRLPPSWFVRYLAVGLGLGALFLGLGRAVPRAVWARRALASGFLVLGTPLGLLGSALAYLTFFSAHSAAAQNYNVLLLPPWVVVLSIAAVGMLRERAWAYRVARWTTGSALVCTAVALVLHVAGSAPQANGQELAVALPLWLSATFAAFRRQSDRPIRHNP